MKICTLLSAYEEHLAALLNEENDLRSRIARLRDRDNLSEGSRLATKLGLYEHQLSTMHTRHRRATCWFNSVATPMFSIIEKRLGTDFRGSVVRDSESNVSLRFCHEHAGYQKSMVIGIEQAADRAFNIKRTISLPSSGKIDELLPLDMTIEEIVAPLKAA